jgi:hypothetical protein
MEKINGAITKGFEATPKLLRNGVSNVAGSYENAHITVSITSKIFVGDDVVYTTEDGSMIILKNRRND